MKGLVGIALLAAFLIGTIGTLLGLTFFTLNIAQSISFEVGYNTKNLIEDKANFDSEKHYLENSLWTAGTYAAYKNGLEGTVYNDPWGFRCSGTDLSGNPYDYVCWRDMAGMHIPSESMVKNELFERVDQTFMDYFTHLEYVEIEKNFAGEYDITPLEMVYGRNELNLSYRVAGLNFSGEFAEHNMNEKGVWVNVTAPVRYLNLYWNASDFTLNSDSRLNDKMISAMENALVCTGDGRLSRDMAINSIQNTLQEIAADEAAIYDNEFEWDIHLLQIHTFTDNHPNYRIEFTVYVAPHDSDPGRKVPNIDSADNMSIAFAIRSAISFTRNVQHVCDSCADCTGTANCGNPGLPASCFGNSRIWWSSEGQTDDCTNCYCEKMEDCTPEICSGGSCIVGSTTTTSTTTTTIPCTGCSCRFPIQCTTGCNIACCIPFCTSPLVCCIGSGSTTTTTTTTTTRATTTTTRTTTTSSTSSTTTSTTTTTTILCGGLPCMNPLLCTLMRGTCTASCQILNCCCRIATTTTTTTICACTNTIRCKNLGGTCGASCSGCSPSPCCCCG